MANHKSLRLLSLITKRAAGLPSGIITGYGLYKEIPWNEELTRLGHQVRLIPTNYWDKVEIEIAERIIFCCRLTFLEYNCKCKEDKLCTKAVAAVKETVERIFEGDKVFGKPESIAEKIHKGTLNAEDYIQSLAKLMQSDESFWLSLPVFKDLVQVLPISESCFYIYHITEKVLKILPLDKTKWEYSEIIRNLIKALPLDKSEMWSRNKIKKFIESTLPCDESTLPQDLVEKLLESFESEKVNINAETIVRTLITVLPLDDMYFNWDDVMINLSHVIPFDLSQLCSATIFGKLVKELPHGIPPPVDISALIESFPLTEVPPECVIKYILQALPCFNNEEAIVKLLHAFPPYTTNIPSKSEIRSLLQAILMECLSETDVKPPAGAPSCSYLESKEEFTLTPLPLPLPPPPKSALPFPDVIPSCSHMESPSDLSIATVTRPLPILVPTIPSCSYMESPELSEGFSCMTHTRPAPPLPQKAHSCSELESLTDDLTEIIQKVHSYSIVESQKELPASS